MSWSRRRAGLAGLAGLAAVALAGCGFSPVYGPQGSGSRLSGRIRLAEPRTPDDFAFVGRLAERLGPETQPRYALDYRLRIAVVPQAITPDEVTTRYALNGSADFVLRDIASGRDISRGQVSSFTSYSTTGTTIATMSAEYDAHGRLARMLADQVVTRLLAIDPARLP
ncbi:MULTISPECIES: LPS assembly lipoprotein LptE [unclassified Paracoccus (in: a-proteobacteria)]|uniref:LPS assembly lipoprotein LptE n=1 Tax=unclassified Paracoccus (in: a-proteobacteria) TaxID=2688777 RepID=UPI0012B42282|nr:MULTISPECIES: LPS assembly lipoprotein LptE [unclassified Paracoccus (in: a-proteobacteria)]UXU75787.1 LPS assembly lipoprotein LptE [Paracoccus sp. SMMA_5]UXU81696.1 LPS assembly lipoprotein LptE [Paracoccus sp. SMMA_5_TC]